MRILPSARKHGVADADIYHALENAMRYVEQEYGGEVRLLIIGPDRAGFALELVAVPSDGPNRIIHADRLRPSRCHYLAR